MYDANKPSQVYPFATKDGQVIPLDIIKPLSIIYSSFNFSTLNSISLPDGTCIGLFFSTEDCIVQFNGAGIALAEDTLIAKAIYVPANWVVTSSFIPGEAKIQGLTKSGRLVCQVIEQWAGLTIPQATSRV